MVPHMEPLLLKVRNAVWPGVCSDVLVVQALLALFALFRRTHGTSLSPLTWVSLQCQIPHPVSLRTGGGGGPSSDQRQGHFHPRTINFLQQRGREDCLHL